MSDLAERMHKYIADHDHPAVTSPALILLTEAADHIEALEAQLQDKSERYGNDIAARIAELEAALEQSVGLQSHYAELLNIYDGGQRIKFADAQAWLDRLAALAPELAK